MTVIPRALTLTTDSYSQSGFVLPFFPVILAFWSHLFVVISEVTSEEGNLSFTSDSNEIGSLVKDALLRDCLLFMIPEALRQLESHADESAAGKARITEERISKAYALQMQDGESWKQSQNSLEGRQQKIKLWM